MVDAVLSLRADNELQEALEWVGSDDPTVALALRDEVYEAATRIGAHPRIGVIRRDLAPRPFRLVFLTGFPYVLVYDAARRPPLIVRIVHAARDLPELLLEL
jgi:toxin ParE1/3/4